MKSSIAPQGGPISLISSASVTPGWPVFICGQTRLRMAVLLLAVCGCALVPTLPANAQSTPAERTAAEQTAAEKPTRPTQRTNRSAARLQNDAIASIKTLLAGKRTTEALQVAEKALRQFPANVQMRFLYGVALTDAGNTDKAIDLFTALSQEHPELAEPYNNLAVLYASAGNLIGARDALEKAVVAVPDYPLAFENLGDVYVRLAVKSYSESLQKDNAIQRTRRKLTLARALLQEITPTNKR